MKINLTIKDAKNELKRIIIYDKHGGSYTYIIQKLQSNIKVSEFIFNEDDFHIINKWMLSKFNENKINVLDVFYCSHHPEYDCECRKRR